MERNTSLGSTSLRKNLDMQRMLALKTISRADEMSSAMCHSSSMSYLLKPSDSYIQMESSNSMNPSDIFNISDITPNVLDSSHSSSSNINLSQSVQEILANSSLKDVQNSVSELENLSKKCSVDENPNDVWLNSISFGSMRNSCAENQLSFEDASFTSFNDDILKRLSNDEKEWRQQFSDIPQEGNKLNFSQFSGYLPSNGSNKMKINDSCKSFGEYFQEGCENLNNMIPDCTPTKSKPVPLVNIESIDASKLILSETQNSSLASNKETAVKSKDISVPIKDETCIASISTISRALNAIKENDSSQIIISTMLQKACNNNKPTEKDVDDYIEVLADNSIISGSIGNKTNKENTNPNIICSASSSTFNSTADFIALTENFTTDLANIMPNLNITNYEKAAEPKNTPFKAIKNMVKGTKNKLASWLEPLNVNKSPRKRKDINIDHSNTDKVYLDMKFEESVIIIPDDSNTSLQALDISIEVTNLACVPLRIPFFVPLKLHSKSARLLFVSAQFVALEINNKKIETKVRDFVKIELPTNSICLNPHEESVLIVKIWGFVEGAMSVTLLLEGFDGTSQKKKTLQHTFNVNLIKPSISISVAGQVNKNLIEFESLPKSSSKTIDLVITNNSEVSLPLKLKLNCPKKDVFSIIHSGEDDGLIKVEQELELQDSAVCGIKFMTGSDSSREVLHYVAVLDIGLCSDDGFELLRSCKITGSEVFSHILFNNDDYPLRLEFGETRSAVLLNAGDIDLSFDIYIASETDSANSSTDDIFTINEKRVNVKKNDQISVQVTLNQELLSSVEKVLIFKQTLNGPVYHWPLIGKSGPVQNYLKNFISPSCKKLGTRSPSPQNRNNLETNGEKSPNGKLSPSKISHVKISHNKVSPTCDGKTSCGSANTGSEISYGGKMPIKSLKTKMSWPTVHVGKSMIQEVTIKNTSEHRMKLNIDISNKAYSLVNNKDVSSSMSLLLHGCEVRSFQVAFSPRKTGLHIANLEFTSNNSKSTIPLVGFGGNSDVSLTGVFRLPNGTNVLSLGQYNTSCSLQKTITLSNKGSLPAFVHVLCDNFKSNFLSGEILVTPDTMIIQPDTARNVDVSFRPGKYNMSQVKQEVLELAKLSIVTGDEGLRQRARQLYYKNPAHKNDSIWQKMLPLLTNIDGEPYYEDLRRVRESTSSLYDLLAPLVFKEISVTIEICSNRNSDISAISIDESLMFHSLCIPNDANESVMQSWNYVPSKLVFMFPRILENTVKISCNFDSMQNFEVTAHPWFKIKPMSGLISEKRDVEILLKYVGGPSKTKQSTSIRVLAENDVLDIPVEINIM